MPHPSEEKNNRSKVPAAPQANQHNVSVLENTVSPLWRYLPAMIAFLMLYYYFFKETFDNPRLSSTSQPSRSTGATGAKALAQLGTAAVVGAGTLAGHYFNLAREQLVDVRKKLPAPPSILFASATITNPLEINNFLEQSLDELLDPTGDFSARHLDRIAAGLKRTDPIDASIGKLLSILWMYREMQTGRAYDKTSRVYVCQLRAQLHQIEAWLRETNDSFYNHQLYEKAILFLARESRLYYHRDRTANVDQLMISLDSLDSLDRSIDYLSERISTNFQSMQNQVAQLAQHILPDNTNDATTSVSYNALQPVFATFETSSQEDPERFLTKEVSLYLGRIDLVLRNIPDDKPTTQVRERLARTHQRLIGLAELYKSWRAQVNVHTTEYEAIVTAVSEWHEEWKKIVEAELATNQQSALRPRFN